MAEYSQYSEISPQWSEFVSQYPELDNLDRIGIVERRRIFERVEASIAVQRRLPDDVDDGSLDVRTFTIPARDGHEIPVRSYVPVAAGDNDRPGPVLVYLHAGGFLFGDLDSGDLNCQILAARLNISVLNVAYRLAPKWPFPHGLNDCYDATVWVAANAEKDMRACLSSGFLVGGISSGANFAAVIAYQARDARLHPPITGLFVSVPVCILPQAYHLLPSEQRRQLISLEQNGDNPMLTRKSLADIQDLYGSPPDDPRISFLLNEDHSGLPAKAYFQICGGDPLRDEAFMFETFLKKYSGTRSKIHVYSGLPHGFWRFLHMKASQKWIDDLIEGIQFLCMATEGDEETKIVIKGQ